MTNKACMKIKLIYKAYLPLVIYMNGKEEVFFQSIVILISWEG